MSTTTELITFIGCLIACGIVMAFVLFNASSELQHCRVMLARPDVQAVLDASIAGDARLPEQANDFGKVSDPDWVQGNALAGEE